jgi:hypothetical protein
MTALIYFLLTHDVRYTLQAYLRGLGGNVAEVVGLRTYEDRNLRFRPGTYVFADLEMIGPWQSRRAARLGRRLLRSGCHVLNDPLRSMRRYELLRTLHDQGLNDFNVFRGSDPDTDVRLPAFLRGENDHLANLTEPIATAGGLREARQAHPDALVVEYLDTSDGNGVFRKYSAFCVDGKIIPRHIFFSNDWMVKEPDLRDPAFVEEELEYVQANPHERELAAIFETARIQYGRIDYAAYQGRVQVWEINTNPGLASEISLEYPERRPVHDLFVERMNAEIRRLAALVPVDGPTIVNPNVWRAPPWAS